MIKPEIQGNNYRIVLGGIQGKEEQGGRQQVIVSFVWEMMVTT